MAVNEQLILEIKADVASLKKGIAQSKQSVNSFQKQLLPNPSLIFKLDSC